MQVTKLCVFLLVLPFIHSELVQVIQLARHGARTPNSFEYIPNQYTEKYGELTALGAVQEYFLGQEIRKRYIEDTNFLSENYNSSEVIIKSSWKNRTIRSAYAFTNGLYPQEEGSWLENPYADGFPLEQLLPLKNRQKTIRREDIERIKLNEDFAKETVEIVAMDGDLYFHAAKSENCPTAERIVKDIKKSNQNENIEKYLRLTLYPELVAGVNKHIGFNLLNVETMTLKMAKSVLDSYRCNSFHGVDHPDINEATLKILKKSRHSYVYKLMLLDDLVKSVSASKLLQEFSDYIRAAENRDYNAPKYVFYSAHDTNLEILLSIFLLENHIDEGEHYNIIPFSSMISFEIHKEQEIIEGLHGPEVKDAHYVKIFFNDEPQLIKWCNDYKCPLEQFYKIMEHHIVPSLDDFCSLGRTVTSVAAPPSTPTVGVAMCSEDAVCQEINL